MAAQVKMPPQLAVPCTTPRTEKSEKEKELAVMDAALAESRAYEESREEEATMRRVRVQDAQEMRREALRELNDATLAKLVAAFAGRRDGDLRSILASVAREYEGKAEGLEGSNLANDLPLCVSCRAFHGLEEWGGLCSRCHVLASSDDYLTVATTCGPSFIRAKFTRFFLRGGERRRKAVPSPSALASGRQLLELRLKNLQKKGWSITPDGACQFRSIAHQLWENEHHHTIVRHRVVAYLEEHPPPIHDCEVYVSRPQFTNPTHRGLLGQPSTSGSLPGGGGGGTNVDVKVVGDDVNAYIAAMKLDTSWGDATTLQACADVFRVRILLVTTFDDQFELIIEPEHEPAVQEIWIGFYAEMHYISVVPA